MNLQSMENWFLYYALTDIKNVENLKMYRKINKLNANINKQFQLDNIQEKELTQ